MTVADNLTSIEAQQIEFTKFQSVAEVTYHACCVIRQSLKIISAET